MPIWPKFLHEGTQQRFFYRALIGRSKFDFLFSNLQKFSFSLFTLGFGLNAASPRVFSSKTLYRALIGRTTFARQPDKKNVAWGGLHIYKYRF